MNCPIKTVSGGGHDGHDGHLVGDSSLIRMCSTKVSLEQCIRSNNPRDMITHRNSTPRHITWIDLTTSRHTWLHVLTLTLTQLYYQLCWLKTSNWLQHWCEHHCHLATAATHATHWTARMVITAEGWLERSVGTVVSHQMAEMVC